jgi:PAS domain S-box-containing protein
MASSRRAVGIRGPRNPRGAAPTHQELLAAAVDSADAIITETLEGTITSCNPAAERLFGYAAGEMVGRSIELLIPADGLDEERLILSQIRSGTRVEHRDCVRRHKDGRLIDLEVNMSPLRNRAGEVIGAWTVARDTGAQQAPAERFEKFRLAVEACPSGIMVVNAAGSILLANPETERMFGYRHQELIGQPVEIIVPLNYRDEHYRHRQAFLASPGVRRLSGRDLFGLRSDGSQFPIEVALNPIQWHDGILVIAFIVDISERKATESALAANTRELERSNAALEQFAYVAAHDLQEPLRMVASYTELLGERYRGKLDERADKYIRYAVEGAKRMQQLINDLLAYSRVGTQGKPLRPTQSGIVMSHVLGLLQRAIREAGADVVYGALPVISADEVQLAQLFQNLIGNALKFRSQAPPRIRIDASRHGDMWQFSVADNGIGIDKEYSERVFQMFQRLHERGKYEGSGIGLAIAKRIVERHGGRIWFDSHPGQGTTFFFTLPAEGAKA